MTGGRGSFGTLGVGLSVGSKHGDGVSALCTLGDWWVGWGFSARTLGVGTAARVAF